MRSITSLLALLATIPALAADAPPEKTSDQVIRKEILIDAPPAAVFRAWTTSDGLKTFFAPGNNIEMTPGGPYEIFFMPTAPEGQRGADGCKVLSFLPDQMLAFNWNAPPSIPTIRNSDHKTQVVVLFEPADNNKTLIKFQQSGFGDGGEWPKYVDYFTKAWDFVLGNCQKRFAKEKSESANTSAASVGQSWEDGKVTVTSIATPAKRQDFEMTVPVPAEQLWNLLATSDGLKTLGGKDPNVELKPGGAYAFWPQANNKVLAFVPGRMLSTSGSAPPKFPNVQKGGTWGVYFFDPLGPKETRLRLSVIGWKQGTEWDDAFNYFLKNNPVFLNHVFKAATQTPRAAADDNGMKPGSFVRHEAVVDAPVAECWNAWTTKDGLESWMVAHASFDLRVGGKMITHYDPKGVLGDEGTIENTILSYDPMRMLSIKTTKAPAKFPFPNAIKDMWTVIYFQPAGSDKTRITCCCMGFGDDDESQKMRKHFEWGNDYTLKKFAEHCTKNNTNNPDSKAAAAR